jgi:hypothetical protein
MGNVEDCGNIRKEPGDPDFWLKMLMVIATFAIAATGLIGPIFGPALVSLIS